ncbi:hypothetical protein GCM10009726_07270 [Nocardioides furvisabuli]|uniref:F5/8 type C domain-containing protein n=1 Tax=Nocardioides furvisabuli TaxID=375542 RepID=A0ABN2WSS2_9ACTN
MYVEKDDLQGEDGRMDGGAATAPGGESLQINRSEEGKSWETVAWDGYAVPQLVLTEFYPGATKFSAGSFSGRPREGSQELGDDDFTGSPRTRDCSTPAGRSDRLRRRRAGPTRK